MAVSHTVLSAVFSDESPYYRFPSEPDSGDTVRIRLRVARDSAERVMLLFESLTVGSGQRSRMSAQCAVRQSRK